jgi:hypothetical protein
VQIDAVQNKLRLADDAHASAAGILHDAAVRDSLADLMKRLPLLANVRGVQRKKSMDG